MPLDTGIADYRSGFQRFCVSGNNPVVPECKGLIYGQMIDPGASPSSFQFPAKVATVNQQVEVLSPAHARTLFGYDAVLTHACYLYFAQTGGAFGNGSLFVIPSYDDGAGTAPEFEITITGAPTAAGDFEFEIPNNIYTPTEGLYSVSTSSSDTITTIATAVAAAINADIYSLYSATSALGVVTLTAKHAGTVLNHTKVLFNSIYGQSFPDGIDATFAQSVTGAGDPDISTGLGNLSNCAFNCWAILQEDVTAIELLVSEIEDRWACGKRQLYGHLFHSRTEADAAALVTYGEANNDETRNIIANLDSYKYAGWMFAAAWAGRNCYQACTVSVGRPVVRDNGVLVGLEDSSPCETSIFSAAEEEQLVDAGLSTWGFNSGGAIFIENNVTNWKYNVSGDRDNTWVNTESRFIVPRIVGVIQRFNNTFYSSSALVDDGVPIRAGSNTTSPSLYKGHLVGHLAGESDPVDTDGAGILGVLLNSTETDLRNDILVEANTDDRPVGFGDCHRLDVLINARLIKQLLRIATGIRVNPC